MSAALLTEPALAAYAVSHAQRRLWVLAETDPHSVEYSLPGGVLLDGPLDRAALRDALQALVDRHESLRTRFDLRGGQICQFIDPQARVALEETDLRREPDPAEAARRLADAEAARPFDLRRGPLFRARLLILDAERHALLYNLPHIVTDDASNAVLIRELGALYSAFALGQPDLLPPLELQYKDFAAWHNERLSGPDAERDRRYWREKFPAPPPVLDLAPDLPRPLRRTSAGASVAATWEPAFLERLERFARQSHATLFHVLLALARVHLFRSTGQRDLAIGTPATSRDGLELENQIGFYVNTLALRQTVRPGDSFAAVLAREKETSAGAFDHALYPFDQLVADLRLPPDPGRTPVFQASVQLQDAMESGLELPGLRVTEFFSDRPAAKVDLAYHFTVSAAGLHCSLVHSADLFGAERAQAMLGQLRRLAEEAVAAPGRRIDQVEMLGDAERRRVVHGFNATVVPWPEATVVELFEAQAAARPDAPAVIDGERTLTYGELNRRANRLAHSLTRQGIGVETRVATFLERSEDWIVTLLGIMKAGAVYVPLDIAYPDERLARLIEDARPEAVLTVPEFAHRLPPDSGRAILLDPTDDEGTNEGNPRVPLSGRNAAYVIYTSGSTGRPKGVAVEHAGLANAFRDQIGRYGIGPEDRVLQFAGASFDASIWEIFVALPAGACVVPIPRAVSVDAEECRRFLADHGVTVAVLFPSVVQALGPAAVASLRLFVTAGEVVPVPFCREFARTRPCFNAYGPTEGTVVASAHAVDPEAGYPFGVPIGRPLANVCLYVLDPAGNPVPVGVPGELCIGGAGVARGYNRLPAQTAAAFVPDPFGGKPGARLYRTGDVARWNAAGELEFLGRRDRQVKLRGLRIDLGEIEAALVRVPEVREAVAAVTVPTEGQPAPRLVAFLVPKNGAMPADPDLRATLRRILPAPLVPDVFVRLAALPLNAAGKIDRTALPTPDDAHGPEAAMDAAPRTDLERVLAGIFAKVIGIPPPEVRRSFFDLGGNSLMATQAAARVRDWLRVECSVTALFEAAGVEELAARLLAASPAPAKLEKIAAAVLRFESLTPEEKAALHARARPSGG